MAEISKLQKVADEKYIEEMASNEYKPDVNEYSVRNAKLLELTKPTMKLQATMGKDSVPTIPTYTIQEFEDKGYGINSIDTSSIQPIW